MKSDKLFLLSSAAVLIGLGPVREETCAKCPCDIYAAGGTPCVAAHSTVRALYGSYNAPLYQVRRTSDNAVKDIGLLSTGGVVNSAVQDSFLNGKPGTISIIYDQSPKKNHLKVSPPGGWLTKGAKESDATAARIRLNGHTVYGVYCVPGGGYRNNSAIGTATGDQAEAMYMVADGNHVTNGCCFDYGNAETNMADNGPGTMEAIYWGVSPWNTGAGTGPWVMADIEDGMYGGDSVHAVNCPTVNVNYLTAMLKGPSGNHFGLKFGEAQSGHLTTIWDGRRPPDRPKNQSYYPKRLEGAIILGIGGDNSLYGGGTFFEGAITIGNPPDSVDDAVQANIVAAGYGKTNPPVSARQYANETAPGPAIKVNYNQSNGNTVMSYTLRETGRVSITIVDQRGRNIATVANGIIAAGRHAVVWNANRVPAGVYVCRMEIDGADNRADKIIVGK